MNILLPCACVHVLMCTHVCVCVHECCQDLFSVSLNLYMPLHQYHHLSLQKALKSHRMILSTSSFCDNSIRLVYIYRDPDCDFNGNCLKPGKLYFAESSSSWIKCFVNYYVCSPSRALFSAYRSFVPSECLCLSISSSFGRRQRVVGSWFWVCSVNRPCRTPETPPWVWFAFGFLTFLGIFWKAMFLKPETVLFLPFWATCLYSIHWLAYRKLQ